LVVCAGPDDQSVTLEPADRRIDLPDVEWPGASGRALEIGAQLVAVLRTSVEQGEETVTDRDSY